MSTFYLALPRIVLAFLMGILCASFFDQFYLTSFFLLLWAVFSCLILLLFSRWSLLHKHKARKKVGLTLLLLSFFSGHFLALHQHDYASEEYFYKNGVEYYQLRLSLEDGKQGEQYWNGTAKVHSVFKDGKWEKSRGKIYVTLETSIKPLSGDLIESESFVNKVQGPRNPGGFDMRQYLYSKNIRHQTFIQQDNWVLIEENTSSFTTVFSNIRSYAISVVENNLSQENYAVAKALILGDKSSLEKRVRNDYATSGAMHILAVSGLHVGIIVLVINACIGFWRRNEKYRWGYVIIGLSAIWFYALITGLPVSVQRAGLMFSFFVVGSALQKKQDTVLFVIASAFILMLIQPYVIYDIGFQLSYAAVLGIIYLQPPLKRLFYSRFWLVQRINEVCAVSIAAQLATLPFTVYYFGYFPVYFLITNIVILPLTPVVLILGLLSILLSAIFPILGSLCLILLEYSIILLNNIMAGISSWPMSVLENGDITFLTAVVIALSVLSIAVLIVKQTRKCFYYSLSMTILFFASLMVEKHLATSKQYLVIFYAKDDPSFVVNAGNAIWGYASEKTIEDYSDQYWVSNQFVDANNLVKFSSAYQWRNARFQNGCIKVNECVCCQINESKRLNYENIDLLWVAKNEYVDLKRLAELSWQGTIVLDASNSFSHRATIKRVALKYGIETYDVQSEGAFVQEL